MKDKVFKTPLGWTFTHRLQTEKQYYNNRNKAEKELQNFKQELWKKH